MRVVNCVGFGPPDKLAPEERPDLAVLPEHVLIDVHACGVSFVDTLIIQGRYQIRPEPPFVPGSETAGVVSAVGKGVDDYAVGDRVIGMSLLNGFADQALLRPAQIRSLPAGLSFEQAAGFVQSYCTAYFSLHRRADLREGETVLVLGAAGGVGLASIDVAKAMGARVIAAASSPEKLDACRRQGADELIDYTKEDLKLRAKALSGGGVDVVVDPVGDAFAEPALRAIAPGGRYLVIGFAGGEIPTVRWNLILLKQCQVIGVDWGGWSAKHHDENDRLFEEVGEWVSEGRLSPLAPATFPLEEAPRALRELMGRRIVGKAVLVTR
ncbi:MAG: NADPH:quinone oxidoreductase family protein [Deltaproteobacteria bacterium]|nr:NADPH:quinone oxidoreductase family protein [Deltaproteobacteria bacterium]